jgi:DnaA family protein
MIKEGTTGYRQRQLPLALKLDAGASIENFVEGGNMSLLAHLRALIAGERHDTLWLVGAEGAGKSHLLQAVSSAMADRGRRAMYVPLAQSAAFTPNLLANLEGMDLVALDDVEQVAGQSIWETRLFSLLNELPQSNASVLLASATLPTDAGFALADLESRAAGGVTYRIAALDDAGRLTALQQRAARRGIALDESAAKFLLHRVRRDMREVCAWLDHLDAAALAAQKRVTIPFIRAALLQVGDAAIPKAD